MNQSLSPVFVCVCQVRHTARGTTETQEIGRETRFRCVSAVTIQVQNLIQAFKRF